MGPPVGALVFRGGSPPRDLHSFPTRRSSDLLTVDEPVGGLETRILLDARLDLLTSVQQDPDRKSTRLNSSHITTSYAVFCLTKKMNQSLFFIQNLPNPVLKNPASPSLASDAC